MNIPPKIITRPIDLGDYAEEYRGLFVYVWVNPPRDVMARYLTLIADNKVAQKVNEEMQAALGSDNPPTPEQVASAATEAQRIGREFLEWWSEILSQHKDAEGEDTHWTVDGLAALMLSETDPALYRFITTRARELQLEHRAFGKKKSVTPFLTSPAPERPTTLH